MNGSESAINEIKKLSLPERVLVVEEIWNSIFISDNYSELAKKQYVNLNRKTFPYYVSPRHGDSWDGIEENLEKINSLKRNINGFMAIHRLANHNLSGPLWIVVEPDDEGFIARCADLPLYGYGDDVIEAVGNLKFEIESLYDDLMEDDNFTEDWLRIKSFLKSKVVDRKNS